jgi:hypothetical protein
MEELFVNPAFQGAGAPFAAALVAAAFLQRSRFTGLAVAGAFALVVTLTVGLAFESLTATRRLMLIGFASAVLVVVLELGRIRPTPVVRAVLAAATAAAAVWMLWRVLQQFEASQAVLRGLGAALYVALLLESTLRAAQDGIRASVTSLLLGLGAGGLALFGASAVFALIGVGIAAGAGAVLIVQMIDRDRGPVAWTLALPAAVIAGMLGLLSVFTGSLPWYCLVPMLAIPWAVRVMQPVNRPAWLAALRATFAGVAPLLLTLGLAWFVAASA